MLRPLLLIVLAFGYSPLHAQTYFVDDAASAGINHYSSYLRIIPGTVSSQGQAMGGGVAWVDINNDGWEDLYLTGGQEPDQLYLNNQDGSFMDISIASGVYSVTDTIETTGVSAADFDRDGDADIIVTTPPMGRNLLFLNNGNGTFTEVGDDVGLTDMAASQGVSCGDYDQDGWVDLYITAWRQIDQSGFIDVAHFDRLYHNNGDGTFTDVTQSTPLWTDLGCGLASVFSDFDLDGDPDLIVANDFGLDPWADGNQIYSNDDGVFSNVTVPMNFGLEMHAMGVAVGDYDEDQDFDYYITNIDTNALLRNDGSVFIDATVLAGVESSNPIIGVPAGPGDESWSWGTVFFDYDHDTYVDLYSANGFITFGGNDQGRLYKNNSADGTFTDVSIITGMDNGEINRGCAVADYDHDGDLDMFLVTMDTVGGNSRSQLLKNVGATGNWLELKLEGTHSNIDAFGAVVRLFVDGRQLLREVDSGGSSFLSHHSTLVHYGLDQYSNIDSIQITWPNGNTQSLYNIAVNQRMDVVEVLPPNSIGDRLTQDAMVNIYPNPHSGTFTVVVRESLNQEYQIFDKAGRELLSGVFNKGNEVQVNMSQFASGVYFLRIGSVSKLVVKN